MKFAAAALLATVSANRYESMNEDELLVVWVLTELQHCIGLGKDYDTSTVTYECLGQASHILQHASSFRRRASLYIKDNSRNETANLALL